MSFVSAIMPRSNRSKLQLSDEEKKKRRREQKKMSMRRARAKLDATAIEERRQKDRERYLQKKQNGLIKTIKDFTPREQRQIRKIWREKSKIRRDKEKLKKRTEELLNENTPPTSPAPSTSRILTGRAVSARNRRKLKAINLRLCTTLKLLEKKLAKYRMRVLRLQRKKQLHNTEKRKVAVKRQIQEFLLDDENSRLTAGKKETITRRQVKKQIRLLNDTLLNLLKVFNNKTGLNISYETFRRHRPFWVLFPKAASRNTCLCSLHTNTNFMSQALYQAKVLTQCTATDVARSLCCNRVLSVSCLERKCLQCSENLIEFQRNNGNDTVFYQRWITKNVTMVVRGQQKCYKKTVKETVKTTVQLLIKNFESNLPKFMQHLANIINQFKATRFVKQNLTPSEGLLHIDFSENYGCKYGEEIQSAHFGGAKPQLSLHTCVYYSTDSQTPQNHLKTTCFCTVSENLRHDPVLICAHLKPIIEQIKLLTPDLRELHILSDGPTTQYRNKTMFYMIANYLSKIISAHTIIWHFTEAGHGKGAPDGIGGCMKRICDKAVANGKDVSNMESFIKCLKLNCKNINVIPIDDKDVCEIQEIAADNNIRPFKGTFQVHQISWSALEPDLLHARRLSCISCAAHVKCPHYEIGQIKVQQGTTNSLESQSSPITLGRRRNSPMIASVTSSHVVPSSIHFNLARSMSASSSVTSPHSAVSVPVSQTSTPSSPAFNSSAPSTPTSSPRVLTPDASTITGPRTPTLPTPDRPVSTREPLTPRKKLNFGNNRSNSLSQQNKFKSVFDDFFNIDDSDENIFD